MSNLTPTELLPLFDLTKDSRQSRQGDRAQIIRFFEPEKNDAFVEKTYTGNLTGLQQRENALLFHISQASVRVDGQNIRLNSRIAPLHLATNSTSQGIFEITVRWQGFDLMDWAKLVPHSPQADHKHLMGNATFLLALARSTLRALYLLHLDGMVHCDIKSDNLCLKWLPGSLQGQKNSYVGQLNPDHLKIIDLGLSLKQRSERGTIPDLAEHIPGKGNHAPRLVAAYRQYLQTRQTQIFEQLDWRVDMWALGHMLEEWAGHDDFLATRSLSREFFKLVEQLKDIEGDFTEGQPCTHPPQTLPHPEIIALMDKLIGAKDDQVWEFSVAVPGASRKSQPAADTVQPQLLKPSSDRSDLFVSPLIILISGAILVLITRDFARPIILAMPIFLKILGGVGLTLFITAGVVTTLIILWELIFYTDFSESPKPGSVSLPVVPMAGPLAAAVPSALIANRYKPQGDGSEVLDTQTGLTWQRFSVGQRWDAATGKPVGEERKITLYKAKKLANDGWRLPTVREMCSLVYGSKGMGRHELDLKDGEPKLKHGCLGKAYQRPTINLEAFPDAADGWYWTSSAQVSDSLRTGRVNFGNGSVDYTLRCDNGHVRLVR